MAVPGKKDGGDWTIECKFAQQAAQTSVSGRAEPQDICPPHCFCSFPSVTLKPCTPTSEASETHSPITAAAEPRLAMKRVSFGTDASQDSSDAPLLPHHFDQAQQTCVGCGGFDAASSKLSPMPTSNSNRSVGIRAFSIGNE